MTPHAHALRAVLSQRDFRRLLSVRLSSQAADGAFQASLLTAVFFDPSHATSSGQAAAAFAVVLLPYSLVGPFAGVFLDRWRRQRVLVASGVLRAALVVVTAAVLTGSGVRSTAVFGLALAALSVNRFVLSALSAALPHVTEPSRLVTANSLTTTLGGGAYAVGFAAAVSLREVLHLQRLGGTGTARLAVLAAIGYLASSGLARRMPLHLLGPDHDPDRPGVVAALRAVGRGLSDGARHVRERGQAARGLLAISAHRFFYGLSALATLLAYGHGGVIGRGITGLAAVGASTTVGSLAAAAVTPAVTRQVGTQAWVVTVFGMAAGAELAFGLPYTHIAFLVAALWLGFAAQASKICVDTLVQESIDDDFRGRVFSLYDTLFNVSFVSAAGLAALLVPADGRSYAVIGVVAAGYAATAGLYAAFTHHRAPQEPREPVVLRR